MEPTKTEEVHPCWICLSDESDDNDKLRDCSCRGDAGKSAFVLFF